MAKEENSGQRGKEWQRWKMRKGWQISNANNKNWSIDEDKLSWQGLACKLPAFARSLK